MPASASSLSALLPASATVPGALSAADSIGLVQALKAVPDPRRRRGRRHGLQSVLLLALQAVMAGASSWVAIAQWSATAPQALGVCGAAPSAATFRRVLAAVDITAVEAALTIWVTGRQARARAQQPAGSTAARCRIVLAVDGKTLRGSKAGDGQPTKLVCVYDHAHRLVLTQVAVAGGDEVAAFALPWPRCRSWPMCWSPRTRCTASGAMRTSWPPAAGTTCSPSRATSRCCGKN